MFKNSIRRVDDFPEHLLFKDQLCLWVWYADKIPPHIGCSTEGKYFSLKANGKDLCIPVSKVQQLVLNKKIPFLLISSDVLVESEELTSIYNSYSCANAEGISCLKPILELFDNPSGVNQLKDLISYLESTERIKHIFGIHLNPDFIGLKEYGQEEIKERLRKLNHVKRGQNFSESR